MKHTSLHQKLDASRPGTSARSAFTSRTMDAIRSAQATETFRHVMRTTNATKKEHWIMKLRKKLPVYNRLKPAYFYSSLAGVVAIGSTATAIALWPTPKINQTTDLPLPSGNRVVGYDEQNCDYLGELKGPTDAPGHHTAYYEIRKGSRLTDQQLESSLLAVCQEDLSNNAVSTIIHQVPKDTPGIMSSSNYIIKAINDSSITVALDPHYSAVAMQTSRANITFTNFATNLLVYDEDSKIQYGNLKVGDSVVMVISSTATPKPNTAYNPFTDSNADTVYGIMVVPPLTGDPDVFYTAVATDLVRVDPCKSDPNGFCKAYDFAPPNP
jgi:hypothetical protein